MLRCIIHRYYDSFFLIPAIVLNYNYVDKIFNICIIIFDYQISLIFYFKNNEKTKHLIRQFKK